MLNHLSIKARLSIAFAAIVALVILAFTIVAMYLNSLASDVRTINDETLQYVLAVDDMNLARSDVQQFLTDVSATHDPAGYKDAEDARARFKSDMDKFRARYQKAGDSASLKSLEDIDAAFNRFYDMGKRMAEAYIAQGMEAGNALMKGANGQPGFDQASADIQKQLDVFHQKQVDEASATTAGALGKANSMLGVMLVSGLAAAALAVLSSVMVVRSILRQLGGEPGKAVLVAQTVGSGDLSRTISLANGDASSLLWHLKSMQGNLAGVVTRVRRDAEGVAVASGEIAEGNHELAARTENQASSLVQTASSMKELADAVEQNAESAKSANQLAQAAASVASQGGEVVGQVVSSIQQVTEIVGRISIASHEQSVGVAQMGEAVIAFEHATQQNAALVEELDAAARTLKEGASNLLHTVSEFTLEPPGTHHAYRQLT